MMDDDEDYFDCNFNAISEPPKPLPNQNNATDGSQTSSPRTLSLYLVSYWWLMQTTDDNLAIDEDSDEQYTTLLNIEHDDDKTQEIVLNLNKKETDDPDEIVGNHEYALVDETMFLEARDWHDTLKTAWTTENQQDIFPIQVRLFVKRDANSLVFKLRNKDNFPRSYLRAASQLFDLESYQVRIWDFTVKITDTPMIFSDSLDQSGEEIILQLQVYGLPDHAHQKVQQYMNELPCITHESSYDDIVYAEPISEKFPHDMEVDQYIAPGKFVHDIDTGMHEITMDKRIATSLPGLTGLKNTGNTCYMNSAIQCVAHTPMLVDYFNKPLSSEKGKRGKLALEFDNLLKKIWSTGGKSVDPSSFTSLFTNDFPKYRQHDSPEFLDALLQRFDEDSSIIADVFEGQHRSTLICSICETTVSPTLTPFKSIQLPLPSAQRQRMTATVLKTDGSEPLSITVTVPKSGRYKELIDALSVACSLGDDETLLVVEICNNCILRFLEDSSDSLELIRGHVQLLAYRLPKKNEASQLVVFMHEQSVRNTSGVTSSWRLFGPTLVTRISDLSNGSQIYNEYMNLLEPYRKEGMKNSDDELTKKEEAFSQPGFYDMCYLEKDQRMTMIRGRRIEFGKPLDVWCSAKELNVLASWSEQMVTKYNFDKHKICRAGYPASKSQECVSLHDCFEAFVKEEPLVDFKWTCPTCKECRQASQKCNLVKLPEVLVVHLVRFQKSGGLQGLKKLDTLVDFPVEELDLSRFLAPDSDSSSNRYRLYAVINHTGTLDGGHYTAHVHHAKEWYKFSDERVLPVGEDNVKTSAAYLLFYTKIHDT